MTSWLAAALASPKGVKSSTAAKLHRANQLQHDLVHLCWSLLRVPYLVQGDMVCMSCTRQRLPLHVPACSWM